MSNEEDPTQLFDEAREALREGVEHLESIGATGYAVETMRRALDLLDRADDANDAARTCGWCEG